MKFGLSSSIVNWWLMKHSIFFLHFLLSHNLFLFFFPTIEEGFWVVKEFSFNYVVFTICFSSVSLLDLNSSPTPSEETPESRGLEFLATPTAPSTTTTTNQATDLAEYPPEMVEKNKNYLKAMDSYQVKYIMYIYNVYIWPTLLTIELLRFDVYS